MSPTEDELVKLSRGLQQANLRLGRVLGVLESREPTGGPGALDALFDLLEGVDAALVAGPDAPGAATLRVARAAALDALDQLGVRPAPGAGPVDPICHRVAELLPGGDGPLRVVSTARTGWVRTNDPGVVLRVALVRAQREGA
jgi:hypothetical protein